MDCVGGTWPAMGGKAEVRKPLQFTWFSTHRQDGGEGGENAEND